MEYKDEWWYSTTAILILAFFGFLIIPGILAVVFLFKQRREREAFQRLVKEENLFKMSYEEKEESLATLLLTIAENEQVLNDQEAFINNLKQEFDDSVANERNEILDQAKAEADKLLTLTEESVAAKKTEANAINEEIISRATENANKLITTAEAEATEIRDLANTKAEQAISTAEEKTAETLQLADEKAAKTLEEAVKESKVMTTEASEKVKDKLKVASEKASETIDTATEEANQKITEAAENAEGITDEANAKAKEIITEADENAKEVLRLADEEVAEKIAEANVELEAIELQIIQSRQEHEKLHAEFGEVLHEIESYKTLARKYKSSVTGLQNFNERFPHSIQFKEVGDQIEEIAQEFAEGELLDTVLHAYLHANDSEELQEIVQQIELEIHAVFKEYLERYSTRDNRTILNLLALSLQAELQVVLYELNQLSLEDSLVRVKEMITRHLANAGNGNQTILPTLTQFLAELEPLYMELIKIEYEFIDKVAAEKNLA